MTQLDLHNDYLIGFPTKYQDSLPIKGPDGTTINLVRWGIDIDKYENLQTTGVILQAPQSLYGPKVPVFLDPEAPKPRYRVMRSMRDGKWMFEGAIPQGGLPVGTLVVVQPGWAANAKRPGELIEKELDELYPDILYSIVQPQCLMAYCNDSTGQQWEGYAGMVMLENFADTTELKSKILLLNPEKKQRQTVRKVIGPGTCVETGVRLERDALVYCTKDQGAPIRISGGFEGTKIKEQSVTFVPASTIVASIKREENMTYTVIPKPGRVQVRPDRPDERWSERIIKPETAMELPNQGTVIAVGSAFDGGVLKTKVGEKVLYQKGAGSTIEVNGENTLIIYETDLWGTLVEDK
jgi:chaperonin GroES